MQSAVETLSPTRVRLTVEVPFAELKPELDSAYKKIGAQVRVQGFRPGKVPARILDQRVGRGTVLEEALNEAVPRLYGEAVEQSGVTPVAPPQVEVTKMDDGVELAFTAEVDVRPEITLPAYDGVSVTVEPVSVSEEDVDEQVESLRERFGTLVPVERPAADGDFLTLDLVATVDGEDVPGGTAQGLSYQLGSGELLEGIDEALAGASAGDARSFQTALVAGELAGQTADVAVTVRAVNERELPEITDQWTSDTTGFATVEEFRGDVRARLDRAKRMQQGVEARDKVLEALLEMVEVPLPESVVANEADFRRSNMQSQLQQSGLTLEGYLEAEGKTAEELEGEVTSGAQQAVKAQLVLDAVADAEELGVTEAELSDQVVRRAQRAGVAPDQLAQQLVQGGQLPMLVSEVRRGKALATVIEAATIVDTEGATVDLEALSEGGEAGSDVEVDEDGRPYHVHGDGSVHYLDDEQQG
ncbi:MAG: Cell division trigger factor [uncultured Nocardioidaceae bacterium]|uniref:Trigger factor n=1 Tax=uncultured Nocardioidaceae bacterium TaxID=253824 RepID=A0A6J4M5W6_9ACTN|nr:MAG: Cell division trigger factor [uncultured Nocardioidaceae bacterium]